MTERLLFVTNWVESPPNGGGMIRSLNLLGVLARRYAVSVVHMGRPLDAEALGLDRVVSLAAQETPAWRTLWEMGLGTPRYVSRWRHPGYRLAVEELLCRSVAAVVLDQLLTAHLIEAIRRRTQAPILLSTHNVEHRILARRQRLGQGPVRVYHAWEKRLLSGFEARATRASDGVVCVSEADAGYFRALNPRVQVVPNGTDSEGFGRISPRPGKELVFVGNFGYAPNEDGALYFAECIWPTIVRRDPDARLSLVGANPGKRLLALAEQPGIQVHANVPEIGPYLARATLAVVPLRFGGGTKLKVLEAMSAGLPVVTTPIGAEGLEGLVPGEHLLVSEDAAGFAAHVSALLGDPARAAGLAERARAVVSERYGWPVTLRQLVPFIEGLRAPCTS